MRKRIRPEDIEKMILYEDKDILVCHKQAGLAVQHASAAVQDLESLLRIHLRGGYLAVIHRLDLPVQGLLVFALNPKAAAGLNRQLTEGYGKGGFDKQYQALVRYTEETVWDAGDDWTLEDYLLRDGRTNSSRVVSADVPGAKQARLALQLERLYPEFQKALVRIHLYTGRHHQIRVQLSHHGMPICGDRKYGFCQDCEEGVWPFREDREADLALCADILRFQHPGNGKKMDFRIKPWFL